MERKISVNKRIGAMENGNLFLSIIVPAYNVEKYIKQCVESILAQKFRDYELILVDDGSTDNTGKICDEYAEQDDRVHVIHKENEGLVSARKAGIAVAAGEYVAYVDGDDWVEEEMFHRLCECAITQKADIVIADFYCAYVDKNDKATQGMRQGKYSKEDLNREVYPRMLCVGEYFSFGFLPCVWGKVFKRSLLLPNQACVDNRIKLGEDAACLYPTLLDADSIFYLKGEYLYFYRIRESSMSHAISRSYYTDEIIILINGMEKQFEKHRSMRSVLQKQLWLYACYMFDNMVSACLNFKTIFFSRDLKKNLLLIAESSIGKELVGFYKAVRTSSRMKRILRLMEKWSLKSKISLYLFWKYEKVQASVINGRMNKNQTCHEVELR